MTVGSGWIFTGQPNRSTGQTTDMPPLTSLLMDVAVHKTLLGCDMFTPSGRVPSAPSVVWMLRPQAARSMQL